MTCSAIHVRRAVGRAYQQRRIFRRDAPRPVAVPAEPDEPRAHRDAARRRVLHRIADQVDENLAQVRRVGAHARQRRADRDREAQSALADQRLELARDVEHERPEHDRLGMNLETAGGDLRDVEHLIDEMAQMRRRRRDPVDRRHLPRRQIAIHAVLQQLDEADDRVERRAQLVRDVREELALRGWRAGPRSTAARARRTLGDAHRLPALSQHATAKDDDGNESQGPKRDTQRLASRHARRGASIGRHRHGCPRPAT